MTTGEETVTYGDDANGQQVSVDRLDGVSATTTNLWDTGSGVAQLVDDGSTSDLQSAGSENSMPIAVRRRRDTVRTPSLPVSRCGTKTHPPRKSRAGDLRTDAYLIVCPDDAGIGCLPPVLGSVAAVCRISRDSFCPPASSSTDLFIS